MRSIFLALVLAAGLGLVGTSATAIAAPTSGLAIKDLTNVGNLVTKVQHWRGRSWRYHWRGRSWRYRPYRYHYRWRSLGWRHYRGPSRRVCHRRPWSGGWSWRYCFR